MTRGLTLAGLCFALGPWRVGQASWYVAKPAHVRAYGSRMLTASNEFRPGTRLEVVAGEKRVVVVVAGSGPFARGRKLDLDRHAFSRLAFPSRGVMRVRYRRLPPDK